MRAPLLCAVVIAVVAAAAQRSDAISSEPVCEAKSLSPVLGISYRSPDGAVAWFDPLTLRMLPGRKAPLDGHFGSWAFSTDRAILAIGSCGDAGSREIRFVNARAMRVLGDLRLSLSADCTSSLTWLAPRRLLAVVQTASDTSAVLVDPVARRVLRRELLPAAPWATGRTREELVVLLGNHGSFAPARLAVVDAEGRTRIATIDRIRAGAIVEEETSGYRSRVIQPGLAVDPESRLAFLVPHHGAVAEVDLQTLEIFYHELDRPSLLGRILRWLTPAAQAKMSEGPVHDARCLGNEMIAVSGTDNSIVPNDRGEDRYIANSVGLTLIDTRSWTTRKLDGEASGFAVGAGSSWPKADGGTPGRSEALARVCGRSALTAASVGAFILGNIGGWIRLRPLGTFRSANGAPRLSTW